MMSSIAEALEELGATLRVNAERPNLLGYVAHEKQMLFHRSPARLRQYIGGNRAGKTTAGAIEALWWATRRHPFRRMPDRPIKGRVVGVDYDHGVADIILPELRRWLIPSDLRHASWEDSFDRKLRILTFANGSTIQFMSGESVLDKFAGVSRDFIWFDEEPSQAVFTENKARTVDSKGSIWITMTPLQGLNWSYETVYLPGTGDGAERDPEIFVVEADMADNPHLDPHEVQLFVATLSPEEREARIHGRYTALGGLVYPSFSLDDHVVPAVDGPPPGWPVYASMDHGLHAPTAWLWHAVGPDGQVLTFGEHFAAEMTVDQHAAVVLSKELAWKRAVEYRVGDPSIVNRQQAMGVVNSVHLDYLRCGVSLQLGDNNPEAGINRVRRYLIAAPGQQPRWRCADNCVNLIREMRHYRWKTYLSPKMRDRANKFEVPLKKDDHACDALRYFLMSRPDISELGPQRPVLAPGARLAPGQQPSMPGPVMIDPEHRPVVRTGACRGRDPEYGDFELCNEHMGGIW